MAPKHEKDKIAPNLDIDKDKPYPRGSAAYAVRRNATEARVKVKSGSVVGKTKSGVLTATNWRALLAPASASAVPKSPPKDSAVPKSPPKDSAVPKSPKRASGSGLPAPPPPKRSRRQEPPKAKQFDFSDPKFQAVPKTP